LLLIRWRRAAHSMLGLGIFLLLVLGYSPASTALLLGLTERFPAWQFDGREPDGIIVLGGAIDSEVSVARNSVQTDAFGERLITMLELARRFPKARIVFTGGSGSLMEHPHPEAPIVGQLLERFGIAPERIVLESESRTTYENATAVRALISPKPGERWLLVTSSFHMPRSIGVFRRAGLDVEAYPVDWRTRGWQDAALPFEQLADGLYRTDMAAHEWIGLLAYWLTGRIDALLPSPTK
jgi:uncharacterized SAM-binding protein YcdF (DUF218 family)